MAPRANELATPAKDDFELTRGIARVLRLPFVDLERYKVSCGLLGKLPAELACRWRCVPMVFNQRRIVLAVDEPFAAAYLSVNPQLLGPPYDRRIEFALTTRRGMDSALHRRITLVKG